MDTTPFDDYRAALHRMDTVAQQGRQTPVVAQLRTAVANADQWAAQAQAVLRDAQG